MSEIPSWQQVHDLLNRSYAWKLLESYLDTFDQLVYGAKMDFASMQQRQEFFDHLVEVFEQDLRLGEKTKTAEFALLDTTRFLKLVIWSLLDKPEANLAVKGWSLSDEENGVISLWAMSAEQ